MMNHAKRPPTRQERFDFGRSRRARAPRGEHGKWAPAQAADALNIILASNAGRLPDLIPIRMGRMARSPFAYFRGAAAVMAADLHCLPTSGLAAQLCGDAHVSNLGAFAAPDGHLAFDLNDFDETTRGPWEWDLKRLAASLVLAGREAGASDARSREAVESMVNTYRSSMYDFSKLTILELARYEVHLQLRQGPVHDVLAKAERATMLYVLDKLTLPSGRTSEWRRFAEHKPLLSHVNPQMARQVINSLVPYRETLAAGRRIILDAYTPVDVAFKVVGLGSVGTRDYVVLCYGNGSDDPLFLQVKEERPSVYTPYVKRHLRAEDLMHRSLQVAVGKPIRWEEGLPSGSEKPAAKSPGAPKNKTLPGGANSVHQGRRVASGQLRIQTVSDPFLGWTTMQGREYLVRQLNDHKATIEPEELSGKVLQIYAQVCGEVLAKAHARTGDSVAIAGYCGSSGKLDRAIAKFALAYADQTAAYYEQLVKAIRAGLVKARPGI